MKKKIIHYFNQGAQTYDAAAEVQAHVATRLASFIEGVSAKRILEIGCGTGLLSRHLVSLFPNASLMLTDISPEMINVCRERFSQDTHVSTTCVDGETLDVFSSFDLISSSMTLHWFSNLKRGLENIISQITSGGRLVFSMLGDGSLHEWRTLCEQYQIHPATPHFPSSKLLKEWFPDLEIHVEIFQYTYEQAYSFLSSLKQLGARAPRDNHYPVSTGKLRTLLRENSSFLPISYEVIYGCYIKS